MNADADEQKVGPHLGGLQTKDETGQQKQAALSVGGELVYGVLTRNVPFLLRYHPKAVAGQTDELNQLKPQNKAALEIIEYAHQCFRTETVRDSALLLREHLDRVHAIYKDDTLGPKRAIVEYQTLHGEARRRHDDVALTAYSLLMIYVRAEVQGDPCAPARQAIDELIAEWAHTATEEG